MNYRRDIDGLRAFAVLSVVGYHAFPNWGRGGFVGVDIFFVISGYLISSIIFDGYSHSTFSFIDFYQRRIRRIFPALTLVLATCLVFAITVAFPKDAHLIGKHVVAGSLFASNWVLWLEAGYFDGASEMKPLLHLWSLSVEEQYYVVWPILVGVVHRSRRGLLTLIVVLLAASFAFNIFAVEREPSFAFYSPFTRAWELLIGSLLAYVARREPSTDTVHGAALFGQRFAEAVGTGLSRHANLAAWCGAAGLVAAVALTKPTAAFPGWWALLPTMGAFLLIGAGPSAWINRTVLASSPAVFFGKISYPLYLWHWPLLAFLRIADGGAGKTARVSAVVLSMVLAWVTYRFIEKPIRFGPSGAKSTVALAGAVATMSACGLVLLLSNGWVQRYPSDLRNIAVAEMKFDYGVYRAGRCFLDPDQPPSAFMPECTARRADHYDVWLWGDSHAASLYPGLLSISATSPQFALSQFTASACPPVLGFDVATRPNCRSINEAVLKKIAEHPPEVLLMAANWTLYNGNGGWEKLDFKQLERTLITLKSMGVGRVVLIGQLPRWQVSQPELIMRRWRSTGALESRTSISLNPQASLVDDEVQAAALHSGVNFFSPMQNLCNASGCELTAKANDAFFAVAWDDAHLTPEASQILLARWRGALIEGVTATPVLTSGS